MGNIYKLDVQEGPAKGTSFILSGGSETLGRGEESKLCILDTAISKVHCRIDTADDRYFIIDLNSRNGTFLNGIRLLPERRYELLPDSVIRLGNTVVRFTLESRDSAQKIIQGEITAEMTPTKLGQEGAETAGMFREQVSPFYISSSKNLSTLSRVLASVGAAADRGDLLARFLDAVFGEVRADRAAIFLAEEIEGGRFRPAAERSKKQNEPFSESSVSAMIIRKVIGEGNALLSTQVPKDTIQPGCRPHPEVEPRSTLCCPVKARDRVFGVIYLDVAAKPEPFKKHDVELLTEIAVHLGSLVEFTHRNAWTREQLLAVIRTLVSIIEAKDRHIQGHSERVALISLAIAGEMGMGAVEREELFLSALLHDVGKAAVPGEILCKPGRLSPDETALVRKHPSVSAGLVRHLPDFDRITGGILFHHERLDGSGYPSGTTGTDIPLYGRIMAVADVFDAMTSDRAHRKALGEREALEEITGNQGTRFDPDVVKAFLAALKGGKISRAKSRVATIPALKK